MTSIFLLIAAIIPQLDTEMGLSVYTIRGGPRPENVPAHFWCREEVAYQADDGPNWTWQLYRTAGAGPLRKTDECPHGTWVPKELDTPIHRHRRKRIGLTNYETYEAPSLL